MNKKGFTLIELLAGLVIVGILFGIDIHLFRGTYASTMTQLGTINDNEIYNAAETYVLETNAFKNNDYACVTVKELFDYGYLKNIDNNDKIIKITRNNQTKVIEEIIYDNTCE